MRFPETMLNALHALQTAYALVDASGRIVEHDENFPLYLTGESASLVGRNLIDVLPELIGEEPEQTEAASRQIKYVNRAMPTGETRYLTLTVIRGRPDGDFAWMVLLSDVTEYGIHFQRLTQDRNEILLLQNQMREVLSRLYNLLRRYFPPTRDTTTGYGPGVL